MILKDLVETISTQLAEKTADAYSNIKQWIFDAKLDMLRVHKFECMRGETTIAATGASEYLLPHDFDEVLKVTIEDSTVEDPDKFVIPGKYSNVANTVYHWLKQGIDAATTLRVVSSAADVDSLATPRKVVLNQDANTKETFALNGTTPVAGSTTFTEIKFVYKDATTGTVTVQTAAGVTLFTLPIRKMNWFVQMIAFNDEIAVDQNIVIRYAKLVQKLSDDYDSDEMQVQYPDVIIEYCLYRGFMDQDNVPAAQLHEGMYSKSLAKAIASDNRARLRNAALDFNRTRGE